METQNKLSNLQIELLKTFSYDLDEKQLLEIKDLLTNYFADKATQEMEKLWDKQNWDDSKISEWASEHMRTEYESE